MFTQQTFDFLNENRLQNSKPWFEAHRPDYERCVLTPLTELVETLAPAMLAIDAQLIIQARVDRTISRIRRDTRFSKDKSLYRDVMWCVFLRDKKLWEGPPGFFFELSPRRWRFGCGYYSAGSDTMQSVRALILQNNPAFAPARACLTAAPGFSLEGERYKRSKFPDQPPELREWLDSKSVSAIYNSEDFSLLCSDSLASFLADGFTALKPFYSFLMRAESCKPREDA